MGWDTWGIVKVKGHADRLREFAGAKAKLPELRFIHEGVPHSIMETAMLMDRIADGFIYWKFYTWKSDGELIISRVSELYPCLEFHSRFGSDERQYFIECLIQGGKLIDVYKDISRLEERCYINENYPYDRVDWDTVNDLLRRMD